MGGTDGLLTPFVLNKGRFELEANELKTYLESRIEVITINSEGTIDEVVSRVLAVV